MKSTKTPNQSKRLHSEETKRKISLSNTGKKFSDERKRNIGKSREVLLTAEQLHLLNEWWSKHYYPKKWILSQFGIGEKLYNRILKKYCVVEQIKFLPQNLEPRTIEEIIDKCKKGIPYKIIADELCLEYRQVRAIIMKCGKFYHIKPIAKPKHRPTAHHKESLGKLLADYNRKNPKKKEKNPNWKGGVTAITEAIRTMPKYKEWRMAVLKRDGFRCIVCEEKDNLHVHHIYPFCLLIEEGKLTTVEEAETCDRLWSIKNGSTLCEECHRKTETYGKQRRKSK